MNDRFDLHIITHHHSEVYCGYFRRLVFGNSLTFSHIPLCFHAKPPNFPRLFDPRVLWVFEEWSWPVIAACNSFVKLTFTIPCMTWQSRISWYTCNTAEIIWQAFYIFCQIMSILCILLTQDWLLCNGSGPKPIISRILIPIMSVEHKFWK